MASASGAPPWAKMSISSPFTLRRLGVTKLDPGELLQMVVQQPGMIDDRLQDQSLAAGNGSAVTAMDGARRQLRARHHVGFARARPSSER